MVDKIENGKLRTKIILLHEELTYKLEGRVEQEKLSAEHKRLEVEQTN